MVVRDLIKGPASPIETPMKERETIEVTCPREDKLRVMMEREKGRIYPAYMQEHRIRCPACGEEVSFLAPAGFEVVGIEVISRAQPPPPPPPPPPTEGPTGGGLLEGILISGALPEEEKPLTKEKAQITEVSEVGFKFPSWAKWGIPLGVGVVILVGVSLAKRGVKR